MKTIKLLILLALLSLTACKLEVSVGPTSTPAPTRTAEMPTGTIVAAASPTELIQPTATIAVPSPTLVLPTPTFVPQPSPTLVPTRPTEQAIKLFMIVLEDNGRSGPLVGCGDSAVPITVIIPKTQGVLRAALVRLLSEKYQFYYGDLTFYNALYQSDLQLAGVTIEQGKAIIHLTGTIVLGGTCDAPRLEAQIEQTALQFSTVNDVAVFVNDVPLKDVLSQK
ncbi:MAG TPA: GerMN domain-containing protein [Anaerolineales bacterium]|nr:GerMN domain-containing protein [Anaerolineales bacterium]